VFVEQVSKQDRMKLALHRPCPCGHSGDRYTFTVTGSPERAVRACCRNAAANKAGVAKEQLEVVLGPWEVD
jgi:hypothetical protein